MLIKLYFSFLNSFRRFLFTFLDYNTSGDFSIKAGRLGGSPQSEYFLAQLPIFFFVLFKLLCERVGQKLKSKSLYISP
jgi:hypothetical protein